MVLRRAHAMGCIVVGHAAVMSLNPHGCPTTLHRLMVTCPPGRALQDVAVPLLGDGAKLGPHGTEAYSGDSSVTLVPFPIREFVSAQQDIWTHSLKHAGATWPVYMFTPTVLRCLLAERRCKRLVAYLDAFVAEYCLGKASVLAYMPLPACSQDPAPHSPPLPPRAPLRTAIRRPSAKPAAAVPPSFLSAALPLLPPPSLLHPDADTATFTAFPNHPPLQHPHTHAWALGDFMGRPEGPSTGGGGDTSDDADADTTADADADAAAAAAAFVDSPPVYFYLPPDTDPSFDVTHREFAGSPVQGAAGSAYPRPVTSYPVFAPGPFLSPYMGQAHGHGPRSVSADASASATAPVCTPDTTRPPLATPPSPLPQVLLYLWGQQQHYTGAAYQPVRAAQPPPPPPPPPPADHFGGVASNLQQLQGVGHDPRFFWPQPWPLAAFWAAVLLHRMDRGPSIYVADSPFAIDLNMVAHARVAAICVAQERGCAPLDAFMALPPALNAAFFSLLMLGHPFGRVAYGSV